MRPKNLDIDRFYESAMKWVTTGRFVEDMYFAIRYRVFCILAACNCRWLPFIRQAENELRRYDKHLRPAYAPIERLSVGIRPWLLLLVPPATTFAAASIIDFPFLARTDANGVAQASEILAGYLKTIATVLAALTGLLLTVIALTINVKTSKLAGADFLLNAITRKRGFLPMAAFLLSTVLTTLIGVVLSDQLSFGSLNTYVWIVGFLSIASFVVLFRVLQRTMYTLGTSELDQLLSIELLSQLRMSFRSALRQGLVERYFSERLADLGFIRYTATKKEESHRTEYKLQKRGKITAIDPAPLTRIRHILKLPPLSRDRNTSEMLLSRPDDLAPYVTVQPNGKVTKDTNLALLTREPVACARIERLVRRTFVVQTPTESAFPWQRIREAISTAIDRHERTTTATIGKALVDTFDDYLEAQAAVGGQGMLLEDFVGDVVYGFKPPNPSNLSLSDLATYAATKGSQNALDELLNCTYILARTAFYRKNEKYFRDWAFEFHWAYFSSGFQRTGMGTNISPEVTRRMHWLNELINVDIHHDDKSPKQVREVTPYAIVCLSLCLHMLRTASERYDQGTLDAVIEHVTQFLKQELHDTKGILDVYRASDRDGPPAPSLALDARDQKQQLLLAYDNLWDYKNLVYVIAGAWLVHRCKSNDLDSGRTAPFVEKLITHAPDFQNLLDLYAMPGMGDPTADRDNPLGFGHWDWHYSDYSQSKWGTEFRRWIRPFYQFLLLKRAAQTGVRRTKLNFIRQTQTVYLPLEKFLADIATPEYSLPPECENHPWSITPEDLRTAKDRINSLLDSWAKQQQQLADDPGSSLPGANT